MEMDTGIIEKAYTTKDVAEMVDIAIPTVRKYAQVLEKQSYDFIRDKNDNRIYTKHDAMAIQHLKTLREKTNISVEQAASIVISKHGNRSIRDVAPIDTDEIRKYERQYEGQYDEDIQEIKELVTNQSEIIANQGEVISKQNELIKDLVSRMDQQQKYIDEKLAKRDEVLLEAIKESRSESQETKRLLIEAQTIAQEAKKVEEKKTRKGILKWFSRD